jgi:dihydroorotase
VTDIDKVQPTLAKMAEIGIPLCVHGEVTDKTVDIFEREPVFLNRHLESIVKSNPNLKVILEHITTKEAVAFVFSHGPNVAATITAHHLMFNRNAIFDGGLRPHMYCLPVLKHENDRQALLGAIRSGSSKFFMGTDSAPHTRHAKESSCGCAGVYTAHAALEFYAMVFEEAECLDKLEAFTSHHGADFYGLPRNTRRVRLSKTTWNVPDAYPFGESEVIPLLAGEAVPWKAELLPEV